MAEDTIEVPTVSIDVAEKIAKPRLEALLLADYASITIASKPDICGIFDEFFVDPEKKTTGFFYLYIRAAETMEGRINIDIFKPDGTVLGRGVAELAEGVAVEKRRVSLIHRMALEVPVDGIYWIDISYKGQSLGGTSFTVKYREKGAADDIASE